MLAAPGEVRRADGGAMPNMWKAGERVRITSTGEEGYVATTASDAVLTMQTDEADVHAVHVFLRGSGEFKLVATDRIERYDVTS